jgi:hypothetical protein
MHTPACCTYSPRSRQHVRSARISGVGRNDFLNSPYVCSFNNHWLSCTSLFLPGRFRVSLAFTSHTSKPCCYYVVYRNPVHPRRLHQHCLDATLFQLFRQLAQVRREAPAYPHWFATPTRSHRYVVLSTSDVYARRIAVHHVQTRTVGPDPRPQLFPLLACEPLPSF